MWIDSKTADRGCWKNIVKWKKVSSVAARGPQSSSRRWWRRSGQPCSHRSGDCRRCGGQSVWQRSVSDRPGPLSTIAKITETINGYVCGKLWIYQHVPFFTYVNVHVNINTLYVRCNLTRNFSVISFSHVTDITLYFLCFYKDAQCYERLWWTYGTWGNPAGAHVPW